MAVDSASVVLTGTKMNINLFKFDMVCVDHSRVRIVDSDLEDIAGAIINSEMTSEVNLIAMAQYLLEECIGVDGISKIVDGIQKIRDLEHG